MAGRLKNNGIKQHLKRMLIRKLVQISILLSLSRDQLETSLPLETRLTFCLHSCL